jgi:hypothetical protein
MMIFGTIAILVMLFSGCDIVVNPWNMMENRVLLVVNKTQYTQNDTIYVVLFNFTNEPVWLEGCSQFYVATKEQRTWQEGPTHVCVWEGIAMKIEAGKSFEGRYPAKYYLGTHKFAAPIYFGCQDGKPISQSGYTKKDKIYSDEFVVE